jgi:predicted dehydrogenase/threonine dehydrogenase-like Zn-dependent dehydrogenase
MRQLIQDLRSGQVELIEAPDPQVREGHVVVRTTWSLISPGTEQSITRTASRSLIGKALDRPDQVRKVVDKAMSDGVGAALAAVNARLHDAMTPGYSSAGVVEDIGRGVAGIRSGDRVACVGANFACHAERILIPAPLCILLPEALDDRWGAFAALGAIAGHGLRTAEVTAGSVVAVVGLGLIGQLTVQLATAAGARVVGIDPDPTRVALALSHGALDGAVLGTGDAAQIVLATSEGAGADAIVLTAATRDSGPVELAAELARDRAIVSVIGDVGLEVPRRPFYDKELQLRLSRSYGPGRYDPDYEIRGRDYPIGYVRWTQRRLITHFLTEVEAGRVDLEPLVTHIFDFANATDAYDALSDPARMGILLRYPAQAPAPVRRVILARAPAATADTTRVGVIGPGLFARSTLLPLLDKLGANIVGVAGASGSRAIGVARRTGAAFASTSAKALIDDPDVQAVVIATRHDSHAPLAAQAMEAGKAVFLEKPVAIDDAGLERLDPLLQAGGRLVVDFNRGFSLSVEKVKAHFTHRTDPLVVQCRVNAGVLSADHWLRDVSVGGGRLVGEGCHFVDLCSAIVERPLSTVSVSALGSGPRTLPDDSFVLTLGYSDGSLGIVTYVATGSRRMAKERIEVFGGGRSAVIDDFRRVRLFGQATGRPALPGRAIRDKGHESSLRCFLEFAERGGVPPIAYERLVETTRATFLARDALAEGRAGPVSVTA